MDAESLGPRVVTYQFEIDDDDWAAWKDTVPRSKALDERLRELIAADTDGRVQDAATDEPGTPPTPAAAVDPASSGRPSLSGETEQHVRESLAGEGDELDQRVTEIAKMYAYLREHGEAEKDELLDTVDIAATGYASRESVWSNMVKGRDTLRALPGVETPPTGKTTWRYTDG